jgi:photosystem II stability/assembly factor-like uncharacterized protein
MQAVNTWTLLGPLYSTTPSGSQVTGFVRDVDAHNLRVLSLYGGLWRFNVGPIAMSDGIPANEFGSFASPPSDPNTILVGANTTGKIYKSTNGGATWSPRALPSTPASFRRIRYSPDGSVIHVATDVGYFLSTDGGTTFQFADGPSVTDFCMVTGRPSTLFATAGTLGQQWLDTSTNGGLSWQRVTGFSTVTSDRGAVSAVLVGPTIIVVAVFDYGIWRSTDGGSTWQQVSSLAYSDQPLAVSFCPSDPNVVLAGHGGYLYRSTDNGVTWPNVSSPDIGTGTTVFGWEDNGVNVWVGMDQGWFQSTDKGATWNSSANVMPITDLLSMDCERAEVGAMLGGADAMGILVTPDESQTWTEPGVGAVNVTAGPVAIDQFAPQRMWASAPYAKLYRSDNSGVTWAAVGSGLPVSGSTHYICTDNAPIPRLFWGQDLYVYESSDTGTTFVQSNLTAFPSSVHGLASSQRVSPSAVVYALTGGASTAGLFVRDGGTWFDRSAGLPSGDLIKVIPHPWAAFADEAWAIFYPNQIFHSSNRGVSWTNVTGDLPITVKVRDLVINPHANELYVGTDAGCWRSLNGGINWEHWVNGVPPLIYVRQMSSIDQTGSGGPFSIVAVTRGRSVFKRDAAGSDPQPAISVSDASCIEGNSGTTQITFQLTLSTTSDLPVLVNYSTADGSALAGSDYQAVSGTITFSPGQTKATIPVLVNGDTDIEPDETFSLVLSNPIRATIANAGTCTIQDDDAFALVDQRMPIVDGTVDALALSGDTLFVGGSFMHVGQATGGAVPFDSTTGILVWLPKVAGSVLAVAPDGVGGWYIGGAFDHVGGQPRQNLAHLLADHTLAAWNPNVNGIVYALLPYNGFVYFGGGFTSVGGLTRNNLAAVDGQTGLPSGWDPEADGTVISLALGAGGTVFAGGDFAHISLQARSRIAALALGGGGPANSWNPGANDEVDALLLMGNTLFVGGIFDSLGGAQRHKIGAVDATSGSLRSWDPGADAEVASLVTTERCSMRAARSPTSVVSRGPTWPRSTPRARRPPAGTRAPTSRCTRSPFRDRSYTPPVGSRPSVASRAATSPRSTA